MQDPRPRPLVSIVLPVLNEGRYLRASLDAIDAQSYPAERLEILVVDGGSTDGTVSIVRQRAERDPRMRLLGGPGTNTPMAMNVGIEASSGEYVAKVDGHGFVSPDFIRLAVDVLSGDPGVGCVGGEIVPIAENETQEAIRIARFSRLGVGGGIYTAAPVQQDIDTVQCGVYRRDLLVRIGGFDPAMQFGEDEEVNHRLRATGSRILFLPEMRFSYHVRPSLGSLFRQYRNYGRARVAVVRKHPSFLRLKHLAPAAVVVGLAGSVAATLFGQPRIGLAGIGAYAVAVAAGALGLSRRTGFRRPDLVAAALACLHIGYGLGTLLGLGGLLRPRRQARIPSTSARRDRSEPGRDAIVDAVARTARSARANTAPPWPYQRRR